MPSSGLRLTVLGSRGSSATGGPDYSEFGCSTSCYLVESQDDSVILDAGSGLLRAPVSCDKPRSIILSHLHLDHLLGLGMYSGLSCGNDRTCLFVSANTDDEARRLIERLYSPPYWPVSLWEYPGELVVCALPQTMDIGSMHIVTMAGNHPGGSMIIRIDCMGKRIVYATDYEHDMLTFARLTEFSRHADLVLYDAQYTDEEYEVHRGFGHSTFRKGIELMRNCEAKRLLLIHHDPKSTDGVLRHRERQLGCDNVRFAREGEVIAL